MPRRLVPILSLAALLAACSQNSSRMEPGSANTSVAGRGRGGGRGGDQALLRGITLSADQQQRVDAIRARYRSQMEQARQAGGDGGGGRGQMGTMMEQQQAEIRAVLTADQQAQFDRNVTEMRSQRGGGRAGGAPQE
jgi:Spy/CpxP family protein refolding chaperone